MIATPKGGDFLYKYKKGPNGPLVNCIKVITKRSQDPILNSEF